MTDEQVERILRQLKRLNGELRGIGFVLFLVFLLIALFVVTMVVGALANH